MRLIAAAALFAALAPAAVAAPQPGQFDAYAFALEWAPAFCEGKPGLPECSMSRSSFAANNLTLHGLWPDQNGNRGYAYCGPAGQANQGRDNAATWCDMDKIPMSDGTLSRLASVMPGTASCLQNHEWYKHGVCSGMSADDYFGTASSLVEQMSRSGFGQFLTKNAGQTVTTEALLSAFEASFQDRNKITLTCTRAGGQSMLLSVKLSVDKSLTASSSLADVLRPSGGGGNCGTSFLLDPAR